MADLTGVSALGEVDQALQLLVEVTEHTTDMVIDSVDFQYLCDTMWRISGAMFVSLSTVDAVAELCTTVAVTGAAAAAAGLVRTAAPPPADALRRELTAALGFDPVGSTWRFDSAFRDALQPGPVSRFPSIVAMVAAAALRAHTDDGSASAGSPPSLASAPAAVQALDEQIGEIALLPVVRGGQTSVVFALAMPHGRMFHEHDLVRLYFRQVGALFERVRFAQQLRLSNERYRLLSNITFEGIVIHRNGIVVDANHRIADMLGYGSVDELLGCNAIELFVHEHDRETVRTNIRKEYAQPYEITALRRDGSALPVEIEARDFLMAGALTRVAAIRDITERKTNEALLKQAVAEKDALLRELQHRAKNSFTMITSLITLSSGESDNTETRTILENLAVRVRSLSELYTLLYSVRSSAAVPLHEYCERVVSTLGDIAPNLRIARDFQATTCIPAQAAPIGLIITELVTNAAKHAVRPGTPTAISVRLAATDARYTIAVTDNGPGLADGFDADTQAGTGLSLVNALCSQLGGDCRFTTAGDGGLSVSISIPRRPT